MKLALIYALLAAIATAINIGTQDFISRIYAGPFSLQAAIVCGTAVGLVAKYVLDKKYIFNFHTRNTVHGIRIFALYALMGLLTTGVFWAFEWGFHVVFDGSRELRYLGGTLGLAIGYATKYKLDQKFVFGRR